MVKGKKYGQKSWGVGILEYAAPKIELVVRQKNIHIRESLSCRKVGLCSSFPEETEKKKRKTNGNVEGKGVKSKGRKKHRFFFHFARRAEWD